MLIIVLGYETPSHQETPEVLYIGHTGTEALAAIEESELPRIERLDGVQARTVRIYTPPAEKKAAEPKK